MPEKTLDVPDGLFPDPYLYPGEWRVWWLTIRDDRVHIAARRPWFRRPVIVFGTHAYAFDFARALEELRHART